ncbi:glycoside hydrolase family 2 TIM barrel-domain containing protein, partial [Actinoallomurus acaciae]
MRDREKRTVRDLRRTNRSAVLRKLYFDGPLSRQELAPATGLSSGSISNVVSELTADGLLEEAGSVGSDGGRPRTLLRVARRSAYLIGVDVGETRVRVELFDLALTELARAERPLAAHGYDVDRVVGFIRDAVADVLRDADGAAVAEAVVPLTGAVTEVVLEVPSPRRWRPNGFGEPYLYTLDTAVRDGSGRPGDERRVRVGFRDVGFVRESGGPASAPPYRLTVGGEPTDILGWNWVPADAMYGAAGEDRLRHLLTLAREAGVMMLRVWGGGLIESGTFYDLCDEYGILVWQEFAQSSSGMSSVPSADPAFVARMRAEATRIVPARRNHPSLAIWCGGNELQNADGVPLTDEESPVLAALHDVVSRLDPDRRWLPTSPSGPVFGNTLDSVRTAPEQHDVHGPWEHQGLADHYRLYDEGRGLLLSEFGVEGMSNLRAIASVVPDARLPTHGDPVWDHLGRWWNNEPLVRTAFDDAIGDLAAMSRASQFLQADGLRYAVEANRRRPESCGVLPWQLNESFPDGWCTASVDYFGEPKAAYHYVRRAYRSPLVCAALPAPRVTGEEFAATVWAGPGEVTARVLRLDEL